MDRGILNILVHSIYFPPEVGGLETHVRTLARAQIDLGHSVRVITSRSGNFPKSETMDGIEVEREFCPNKKLLGWVVTTLAGMKPMRRWASWADICHVHTFPSIIAGNSARKRGVPLVATIHTSHFLRLAKKPFWRKVLAHLLSKPDLLLTPSAEIRDVCLELYPAARIHAMVNAADTDRFRSVKCAIDKPSPSARMIVIPRRLFEKNGVEFAIRALPLLREKHDAHIYIVGDGPLRKDFENLASELGIREFVHFEGARPNIEMPSYLSSAEVVVIPSLMEATSVAGLEAMSCERAIVASDVGGLPEIVSNDTGRLVPPQDPGALARAVSELLELPEESRRRMGKIARDRVVENWSVENLARQVLEYYNEATDIFASEKA